MTDYFAKGIASSKSSGSTLVKSGVSLNADSALTVALGYDDAQGHPTSVTWGNRKLKSRISRNPAGYDIAMSVWTAGSIRDTATRAITVTWAGDIVERAMIVTSLEGVNRINQKAGNNDAVATSGPVTGETAGLKVSNDFVLCYFVSEGPDNNDTPGTAEIKDAGTFVAATLGQRAGTNGTPVASNVTIQEAYLSLTACSPTEGRLVGATSRLWTSAVIALDPLSVYVKYVVRGKCPTCGSIVWCDDHIVPVGCACGDHVLYPDGSGGLDVATDAEMITEFLSGYDGPQFDEVKLTEI